MSLLAQARLFNEERLIKQCLQVIDKATDIALYEPNVRYKNFLFSGYIQLELERLFFRDVDRETLMEVLSRSQLDPTSELVIFNASKSWAEAECERRGILSTAENLRTCLGPTMQLIRFPLMNVIEFGHAGIKYCVCESGSKMDFKPARRCLHMKKLLKFFFI